jgi:hypothetical protein
MQQQGFQSCFVTMSCPDVFCRSWSVHQPLLTLVQIEDDNPYANLEKKSKKGRKAEKNAAKPPAEKPLNHSLDIMGAFAKLSIEAPTSVSKVGCTRSMRWQASVIAVHAAGCVLLANVLFSLCVC